MIRSCTLGEARQVGGQCPSSALWVFYLLFWPTLLKRQSTWPALESVKGEEVAEALEDNAAAPSEECGVVATSDHFRTLCVLIFINGGGVLSIAEAIFCNNGFKKNISQVLQCTLSAPKNVRLITPHIE